MLIKKNQPGSEPGSRCYPGNGVPKKTIFQKLKNRGLPTGLWPIGLGPLFFQFLKDFHFRNSDRNEKLGFFQHPLVGRHVSCEHFPNDALIVQETDDPLLCLGQLEVYPRYKLTKRPQNEESLE